MTLGEICDAGGGSIQTGPFGSQLHKSDYSDAGTPVVMPKDIVGGTVSVLGVARVSETHVKRLTRHQLVSGDIVYGRRGNIGRHAYITKHESGWLCGTGCLKISPGEGEVDPLFLHYYLDDPGIIAWIKNRAIGATMPNLNTAILRSVPINFPDRKMQVRIASILAAYDDLIENNTRRITILAEMAQAIYREWFVHFRFPGHHNVKMVESELGMTPDGWEVVDLQSTAEVQYGFSFKSTLFNEDEEGVRLIRIRNVPKNASSTFTTEKADAKYHVEDEDILVGMDGDFHMCRWAGGHSYLNQRVARFRPSTDIPKYYLFLALADLVSFYDQTIVGTTVAHLLHRHVKEMRILQPPDDIFRVFDAITAPLYELEVTLRQQRTVLQTTRDLLLPKLISGKIDVSKLDIDKGGLVA